MISNYQLCYIVGDFNIDHLSSSHEIPVWVSNHGFCQLVNTPTHEEGGLLDHVYIKSLVNHKVHLHWPYYSDHAALCIENVFRICTTVIYFVSKMYAFLIIDQ